MHLSWVLSNVALIVVEPTVGFMMLTQQSNYFITPRHKLGRKSLVNIAVHIGHPHAIRDRHRID
jgi:hypothetical protein